jgi:allene oxide cyclase
LPFGREKGNRMRRKLGSLVVVVSVCALTLVVLLDSGATARLGVSRLVVIEHATTDTLVDLTTNGDSTGDLLTFHNDLYDESNSDVIGSDQGDCVRIEVGVSWECRWVNVLDGGSISVEGPFFDAGPSALAITGGTGDYRGARGSMRLVSNEDGTEFTFVFRILSS